MLILLCSFSAADIIYFQESDAHATATSFYAYSSGDNNVVGNLGYQACFIPASEYTPVGYDFDDDAVVEFIITESTYASIYDANCNIKDSLDPGYNIIAEPVLTNYDNDAYPEIAILTETQLYLYEYSPANDSYDIVKSMPTGLKLYGGLICTHDRVVGGYTSEICIASMNTTQAKVVFDLNADTVKNATDSGATSHISGTRGMTYTRDPSDSEDILIPRCNRAIVDVSNKLECNIFNVSGNETSFQYRTGNIGNTITSIQWVSTFIGKLGGAYYLFSSGRYTINAVGTRYISLISDLTGTSRYERISANPSSNWVISRYNTVSGTNYACIFLNDTGSVNLICYDAAFNIAYNISYLGYLNSTEGMIMADFNGSDSFLGIATGEGIFYRNKVYNVSGLPYSASMKGSLMTISQTYLFGNTYVKVPFYAYTDGTDAFIMRVPYVTTSQCGNSVCDAGEDEFSCPDDCSINSTGIGNMTGTPCSGDDQCMSGKCQDGYCVLKLGNEDCENDAQCLSGFCTYGKCQKPGIWALIDAGKDEQFGDDTNSNNIVALIIILGGAAGIIIASVKASHGLAGVIVAMIWAMGSAIFFTIVGWLSVFIMFGMFIVTLLLLVLGAFLKGGD